MAPLRILLATEIWFGASGAGLAHGFRSLGHDVIEITPDDYLIKPNSKISSVLMRATINVSAKIFKNAIINAIKKHNPDVLFTAKGNFIDHEVIDFANSRGICTINYYPDNNFTHNKITKEILQKYSIFITTKSYHEDNIFPGSSKKIHFVSHGYSTLVHRYREQSRSDENFSHDIGYIGSPNEYKLRWMLSVAEHFPDKRILLGGNRWEKLVKGTILERAHSPGPLVGDLLARAIERCRINIAVHFGPVGREGWADQVSTRTFEIPACGGFMLHIDNEEVRGLYEPGKEIDVFSTPEELNQKIAYYLDHPEERMRIADAGHKRAVPAYSYDARAAEIVEIIRNYMAERA